MGILSSFSMRWVHFSIIRFRLSSFPSFCVRTDICWLLHKSGECDVILRLTCLQDVFFCLCVCAKKKITSKKSHVKNKLHNIAIYQYIMAQRFFQISSYTKRNSIHIIESVAQYKIGIDNLPLYAGIKYSFAFHVANNNSNSYERLVPFPRSHMFTSWCPLKLMG